MLLERYQDERKTRTMEKAAWRHLNSAKGMGGKKKGKKTYER